MTEVAEINRIGVLLRTFTDWSMKLQNLAWGRHLILFHGHNDVFCFEIIYILCNIPYSESMSEQSYAFIRRTVYEEHAILADLKMFL